MTFIVLPESTFASLGLNRALTLPCTVSVRRMAGIGCVADERAKGMFQWPLWLTGRAPARSLLADASSKLFARSRTETPGVLNPGSAKTCLSSPWLAYQKKYLSVHHLIAARVPSVNQLIDKIERRGV